MLDPLTPPMTPKPPNERDSASLSRPLDVPSPRLVHSLNQQNSSVLSVSADEDHVYSGSQCQDISVWDRRSFTLKTTLKGHTGSILALEYAEDRKWLFSSSGDSTIRVWSTETLLPLYIIHPYLESDAGDLFSLVWSPTLQTIYFGCQNTSVQWYRFDPQNQTTTTTTTNSNGWDDANGISSGRSTPSTTARKAHKFFDSYPQYTRKTADLFATNHPAQPPPLSLSLPNPSGTLTPSSSHSTTASSDDACVRSMSVVQAPRAILSVPVENVVDSAHFGYVYCMALVPSTRAGSDDEWKVDGEVRLVTGSGDETVKLWNCRKDQGLELLHEFECCHGAVLSLTVRRETVYAGCQEGYVKVWDLETRTLVRTIIVQEGVDILSLSMLHSDLYTASANGIVQRWSASFDCTASWSAHDGIVLSSIVTRCRHSGSWRLVTGANDDYIKVWEVEAPKARREEDGLRDGMMAFVESKTYDDKMIYALSKFVSIPSVSSNPSNREDCRQTAIWLKKCLNQLGAEATLIPTGDGTNPLVLGTFNGSQNKGPKPRILFYGHYDVISAPPPTWLSDPFTLTGRNGYLYGRGVTDNKGPIMAVACAAAELLKRRKLGVDLVFLVEGEEECGSGGFEETVRKHKDEIGKIDAILVSNSTWITEYPPCITYGLRGVVHCTVEIWNNSPDVHSGVEGGAVVEPMLDMIKLLSSLTDAQRRVLIPGFYERVRPLSPEEKQDYQLLSSVAQKPVSVLSSRWREPSLTIHNVEVSGPRNPTVIPCKVKAQVSVRIVPDQDLETIASCLCDYLKASFAGLQSPNKIEVHIDHKADWWLGNLEDPWFKILEQSVRDEWNVDPLRIREGGSIPSVPYLEKEFGCHALHLPLGQSSDQAHLPNERISLMNLQRGKSVIERFLCSVGEDNTVNEHS